MLRNKAPGLNQIDLVRKLITMNFALGKACNERVKELAGANDWAGGAAQRSIK